MEIDSGANSAVKSNTSADDSFSSMFKDKVDNKGNEIFQLLRHNFGFYAILVIMHSCSIFSLCFLFAVRILNSLCMLRTKFIG